MNETRLWTKDYIFLLLAVFFAAFTHNIFIVVFPVYMLHIGGSNALTGLMMSGLTISGIITRLIVGSLIDRLGRKKILILGSTLFSINTIAYCFISNISGLFVLRVLNGITQGIFFPVPPTIVADIAPRKRLVDGMSYFGISAALASSLAPIIGLRIFQNYGSNLLFIMASVFTVISVAFTLFIKDKYRFTSKEKLNLNKFQLPKISTIIEISVLIPSTISFFIYFGNSSITNFLATCGIARGITNVSIFFLINNMVMIITRLFTGRLVREFGKMKLILGGCGLIFISTVLIAFSFNIYTIIIASIIFGIGVSISTQLLQVIILELVNEERRGVANSTFMLLGDIRLDF